jgi:hypothetical protein
MEHLRKNSSLKKGMNTTGKIALGVSFASSMLLAAWLLTGERKVKTKQIVSKSIRGALKSDRHHAAYMSELDSYYI